MICWYKPFFSLFDSPKKKVLKVINSLTCRERELLIKKYDKDFSNTEIVFDLTEEENKEINERIIRKIRLRLKRIEEDMCLVSIHDVFANEILNDIKKAMEDTGLLGYFQILFGSELDGLCYTYRGDDKNKISKISKYRGDDKNKISKISKYNINMVKRRIAKNKGLHRVRIIKPFVSLFIKYKRDNETFEEFEDRLRKYVSNMSDKYKRVIYALYNEDLNNFILKHPSSKEVRKIFSEAYHVIVDRLERDLKVEKTKNVCKYKHILTLFDDGVTLSEVREKLKLNDNIYMLSKKKYGEDLNTPSEYGTLTRRENHLLYEFYYRVNNIIFREKKMYALINAKNMLYSPVHKAFSGIYGFSLAYGLVLYLNFSKYLSLEVICDIALCGKEELLEVIENYENSFKKKILRV